MNTGEQPASWYEEKGIIYFSVTSDGRTGEEWIKRLEEIQLLYGYVPKILRSSEFKPTTGVTTKIAVIKGRNTSCRVMDEVPNIGQEASEKGFKRLSIEVACLIREKFTLKDIGEMGLLAIVVEHRPIEFKVYDREITCGHNVFYSSYVLLVDGSCYCQKNLQIGTHYCGSGDGWKNYYGFAFADPTEHGGNE